MELKDIKAIIDLMKKNSITEFELEQQDSKIRLKRGLNGGGPAGSAVNPVEESPSGVPSAVAPPVITPPPPLPVVPPTQAEIKSPMIGTFYRAPSPEAAPYVDIGAEVNPDTVVCIIEAMKVMNEIKAEVKGSIVQVLVENGKPVEFGQPLFRVRPV
ncbi:MAG: acetyl-CoA carboxylase biotin carboxyl carrier protein [Verrucomicrobiota bacterium]|nr:acetyl-CoA carboxylase biotin carboxyl carrier protein [Verrucomicrobiota bacterium]